MDGEIEIEMDRNDAEVLYGVQMDYILKQYACQFLEISLQQKWKKLGYIRIIDEINNVTLVSIY